MDCLLKGEKVSETAKSLNLNETTIRSIKRIEDKIFIILLKKNAEFNKHLSTRYTFHKFSERIQGFCIYI